MDASSHARKVVLDEVLQFNKDRKPKWVRIKLARMDVSAFTFFRGSAHLFARSWTELKPADVGPLVWLCGDLHLENFGAYRSDDNDFLFDINDFDEALIAPAGVDLTRCAASILLAAEQWRLTPLQASGMVLAYLDNYREALCSADQAESIERSGLHEGRGAVWDLLGATALGSRLAMLNHMTKRSSRGTTRRLIKVKGKRPPLRDKSYERLRAAIEEYGSGKPDPDVFKVRDVSARIAGIGSLGVRRYLVLIEGDGSPDGNRILDVKEARPSAMLACAEMPQPDYQGNEARRVVEAQRRLQAKPTAGLDVVPVGGRFFRMREMIPDENRSSLDRLQKQPEKLRQAVEVAGRLTGWSHLRGARRGPDVSHAPELVRWAGGPALDAVFAAAARFAERTRIEYEQFHRALRDPGALPKPLRHNEPASR